MVRARARDGLNAHDAALRERGRVAPEDEPRSGGRELRKASDGEILVVEIGVAQEDLGRLPRRLQNNDQWDVRRRLIQCRCARTFLTTGSTHGLLLSSRYAPTPKFTFFENVSALYAAVSLKMLSRVSDMSLRSQKSNGDQGPIPVRRRERHFVPRFCNATIIIISPVARTMTRFARTRCCHCFIG